MGAVADQKPWITGANDTGIGAVVNPIYAGEDNVKQAGVDITSLSGSMGKSQLVQPHNLLMSHYLQKLYLILQVYLSKLNKSLTLPVKMALV
ncbi:hypothetical protein KUH03_01605 [Sphingobacterium sp. E70]|uniref:hypothetical protein n=1 Tax=Sphingobacterium sp. E70 TaxID=2853439 RepID=UPI00211B7686|nr:hypothetical protein [Sphingobacterium sp. E70]ULT25720.1 hypothetical protein KUH03_01605 [Sphingobacterium sp. E70]